MLSPEQRAFYEENGYVLVPGLLTPDEAAALRHETHALMERLSAIRNINATWGSAKDIAGGAATQLLHCHDVQFQSAAFARLIVDERVTGVAADIIGPNVQLHHTKAFVKPPEKGSPFPMHQDAPFFPHDNHSMIAVIFTSTTRPRKRAACVSCRAATSAAYCPHPGRRPPSAARRVPGRGRHARSRQGRRCALLFLPDCSRLGYQYVQRAAHYGAHSDARPRRPANGPNARIALARA
jgi:hypothetical protein